MESPLWIFPDCSVKRRRASSVQPKRRKLAALQKLALLGLALLLLSACSKPASTDSAQTTPTNSSPAPTEQPWFEETAAQSGLDFHHVTGASGEFWMPESMVGGVGLLDYDNDGWLDVFCVQGGSLDPGVVNSPGNQLFRNRGDGTFEDVTDAAGVKGAGYGSGCVCADYDNDGNIDIYVTYVGNNALFRNNGDNTFTEVAEEAGVADNHWGASGAFFDYDADGFLDLVVVNYVNWSREQEMECHSRGGLRDYCSPLNYRAPTRDVLYRNKGDGTFEDVSLAAGLDKAFGNGLGVVCADFNLDGKQDFYVANDASANQLWINQGGGRFKDEAMIQGCAVNNLGIAEAGMGVVGVDIQNDGRLDLFMTHLVGEANRLYVNQVEYFEDSVTQQGPGKISWPYTGFGLSFADFNHDGNLDLYVANGRIKYGETQWNPNDPYAEPDNLLRGLDEGGFEEVNPHGGVSDLMPATGRGMAVGDLDNDGDVDIVVVNRDAPARLLRNQAGSKGNWLLFRVLTTQGRDAIGAMVRIEAGELTLWRQVNPNQGYCSSNDPRVHVGIGARANVERIVVKWVDGKEEAFGPYETGKIMEVREGSGSAL